MTQKEQIKKQAMSAIAGVKSLARVGMVKVTAGAAVYAAHIRQIDRQTPQRPRVRRDAIGREI